MRKGCQKIYDHKPPRILNSQRSNISGNQAAVDVHVFQIRTVNPLPSQSQLTSIKQTQPSLPMGVIYGVATAVAIVGIATVVLIPRKRNSES